MGAGVGTCQFCILQKNLNAIIEEEFTKYRWTKPIEFKRRKLNTFVCFFFCSSFCYTLSLPLSLSLSQIVGIVMFFYLSVCLSVYLLYQMSVVLVSFLKFNFKG